MLRNTALTDRSFTEEMWNQENAADMRLYSHKGTTRGGSFIKLMT